MVHIRNHRNKDNENANAEFFAAVYWDTRVCCYLGQAASSGRSFMGFSMITVLTNQQSYSGTATRGGQQNTTRADKRGKTEREQKNGTEKEQKAKHLRGVCWAVGGLVLRSLIDISRASIHPPPKK
jgi:hypothetical protein